jgi:hypothetical protein
MSGADELVLMIAGVHLLGIVLAVGLIIPALRERPEFPRHPGEGSDGGGGPRRPSPETPVRPTGGLPLPDAVPARVRLREPGRLSELRPPPERRPAREPDRVPGRVAH